MKPSTRVCHVLYSFGTGGLEKGITMLANHGSPQFEHVIVCMNAAGDSSRLLPRSTRVVELHKPDGHSVRFLWSLSRCLKRLNPDVVHTRNWTGMDGIVAAHLGGLPNLVHGEHGWGVDDPFGENFKRIQVRRLLGRGVTEQTCVSRQMITWLKEVIGIERPITQIYNGIDTESYRPGPPPPGLRGQLGIPEGALVIGTVGRLDPIKDHPSLFRAFDLIGQGRLDPVLLVIGDGAERQRLEGLASSNVRMLGNRHDIPDLLRLFDVFVLPSINEGISNTILEAMATGLPVVATRVGGTPELVKDGKNGTLVRPGEVRGLAGALSAYLESQELRGEHGGKARRLVVDRFSIEAMVAAYEEVYRRVAQG